SRPWWSLSTLVGEDKHTFFVWLASRDPLPDRLAHSAYLGKRAEVERWMYEAFAEAGGEPERRHPHYFVLGTFALWESDGSRSVSVPLASLPARSLSFTLTDSFFNYFATNLRGHPIPPRAYHRRLYPAAGLDEALSTHDLPTDAWRTDPQRRFEPYVEAQAWSDRGLEHLLDTARLPDPLGPG
ncbi:MAG: hypothetical protein ACR2PQ_03075, partial [Myxococcota bacterium]